jgi:hypothetical protein
MDREARFEWAVGVLYDAAAEPERWPGALTGIADLLGAVGAQFYFWDKHQNTTQFAVVGRLPEEGNEAYMRHYGAIDTRRQALERIPVGKVTAYDLDFDGAGSGKSEFLNDFPITYRVPYIAEARPFESANQSAVIAVLQFHQGPFARSELATFGRLVPHLQRTARLHLQMRELRLRDHLAEAALDRLPFGVVVGMPRAVL